MSNTEFQLQDEASKLLSFQTLGTRMSQLDNIIKRRVRFDHTAASKRMIEWVLASKVDWKSVLRFLLSSRSHHFISNPFLKIRRTRYSFRWKLIQETNLSLERCPKLWKEKKRLCWNCSKKLKSAEKWWDRTPTFLGFVYFSVAFLGVCTWKRLTLF